MMFSLISLFAGAQAADEVFYANLEELEHFRLVNEIRAAGFTCPNGAVYDPNPEPLKLDCRLVKAARLHSEDMYTNDYFSHTSLDGRRFTDRAKAQGVSAGAENLTVRTTAVQAVESFLSSTSGHCNIMMSVGWKIFGVGYAERYWTQLFGGADGLDTSCLLTEGETFDPTPQPTRNPTPAPPTGSPTHMPTPMPTPAPPTHSPTKQVKTKMCPGSPAQRCRMLCLPKTIQCQPDECLMRKGTCCTRKCQKAPTAPPTFAPTTRKPTALPTSAPTSAVKAMCQPLTACADDYYCNRQWLPHCAAFGADGCGSDATNCQLVNEEWKGAVCIPHPSDVNATWDTCYSTIYITEQQCLDGAATNGVTCQWVYV